jgi:hypothetical protein
MTREAFQTWGREFTAKYGLPVEAGAWLIELDRAGYPHRKVFLGKVRDQFGLSQSVDELWSRY